MADGRLREAINHPLTRTLTACTDCELGWIKERMPKDKAMRPVMGGNQAGLSVIDL
jgi:hypothetical protein